MYMETFDFKTTLGLNRCVPCSDWSSLPDDQRIVCEQVKDFGIDEIYFSTDESKSYPAVFLKKVSQFDIDTLKEIARIHKYIWNYQKVLFLYVYSDIEIRIYNCTAKPFIASKDTDYYKELQKIELQDATSQDQKSLSKLIAIFSSIAIDTGIVWTLPEAIEIRKKINLQKRVDRYLVDSLTKATKDLHQLGLTDITIIHKIILRSLFLLYLEDRGATGKDFYETIKPNAKTYYDILEDVEATYRLFAKLEEQFNGNVFSVAEGEEKNIEHKHLEIIRKCFINGYEGDGQAELFSEWRLFDFNIIQIELISEIYERFLAETDEKKKKNAGAFYTPPSLVTLILDEVLPIGKKYTNYNVKILDPACGSGIFLVESYKRLLKRYENAHNEKLTDFKKLNKILTDNIYGIEQNNQAIIVAAFSLYLALVDNLAPKTLWLSTKLPCLINDPDHVPEKKKGNNLFCRDTIAQNDDIESIQFDLVVGNPPFGTENKSKGVTLSPTIRNYCNKYGFAKEMVLPFLHKAIQFAPIGKVALIFNAKILTNINSTYQNFRKWLFNECYVSKIYNFSILRNAPVDFGGQLFGSAIGPICIGFYQKEQPSNFADKIIYYAPKTYIKSNIIEGVIIDSYDVKYLPREVCQKPDSKIWKIAMWGVDKDLEYLQFRNKLHASLSDYLVKNNFIYGVGFETSNPTTKINTKIKNLPVHTPKTIDLYSTDIPQKKVKTTYFRRLGMIDVYTMHHVLVNEGIVTIDNRLQLKASYIDYSSAYTKGVVGIASKDSHDDILKIITLFLNSSYALYYAFIATSSWGIERDVVKHNELFNISFLLDNINNDEKNILLDYYNNLIRAKKEWLDISEIRKQIDDFILNKLTNEERLLIEQAILNIDLFKNQAQSKAILPCRNYLPYIQKICSQLDMFLGLDNIFANGTYYSINNSPLAIIKISFDSTKEEACAASLSVQEQLHIINQSLYEKHGANIYFRKKINYYGKNCVYIIRPNQQRFWTQAMALSDASEIVLDILNMED